MYGAKVISIFLILLIVRWIVCKCQTIYNNLEPKVSEMKLKFRRPQYGNIKNVTENDEYIGNEYTFDDSDIKYYNEYIEEEFDERNLWYNNAYIDSNARDNTMRLPDTVFELVVADPGAQNVHDRVVQRTLKQQYEAIKKPNEVRENSNIIEEYIMKSSLQQDDKIKCLDVLKQIRQRNAKLTNFGGDTEVEILNNTWSSGDSNVRDYLLQQLLDSAHMTTIYCPTGVASRIVNASMINEPEKMAKTREAIHEEMMQTAANLRSKLEETQEYNQLDEATQSERLRESIKEKYKEDYITTGILEGCEVEYMTKDWIEHI